MKKSADLSADGLFRWSLTRTWELTLPVLVFIMLNPSTADADADDPTIRKCIGFAKRNGFGGIEVVNLFAWRATDPKDLKARGYLGANLGCDSAIYRAITKPESKTICAWGANARGLQRPQEVLELLRKNGVMPHYLRLTDDGIPCHPLMLPYSCEITEWEMEHV